MSTVVTLTVEVCLADRHTPLSEHELYTVGQEVHDLLKASLKPSAGRLDWATAIANDEQPAEPERVENVLKKYALSTQREPMVSFLTLTESPWGRLELGAWADKHDNYLFLDGVPIDVSEHLYDDLYGPEWELMLNLQNYLSRGYATDLRLVMELATKQLTARDLCAFLAGREGE